MYVILSCFIIEFKDDFNKKNIYLYYEIKLNCYIFFKNRR